MLLSLSIRNVAVIECSDVEFEQGFNVLTGETGAGKSILIDSLSMVLGLRTSKDIVRSGADFACVSALFTPSPDLSDLGIESEEDNALLLTRKLYKDGKNICKINASTVPLSLLRTVGERLVAIHGQNSNLLLLKPSYHLSLLDEFAGHTNLLEDYRKAYGDYRLAQDALSNAKTSESEREQKKDILQFRIEEINSAAPIEGEDEALLEKCKALRSFGDIKIALESASDALSQTGGAVDCLYDAMQKLIGASKLDLSLQPLCQSVTDIYYSTADVASEIVSKSSDMVFSPDELDMAEERLDILSRLKKKYGAAIGDIIRLCEQWQHELDELLDYDENITRLEDAAEKAKSVMLAKAQILEASRKKAATKLSNRINEELEFLDMPKSRFDVSSAPHSADEHGIASYEFMISTAPSEGLKPLAKIASGGEMSRIMLALKSALADCEDVGVLLFDEIDTGVSGRAAVKIAAKLKALAQNKQIICVTHLPQMACAAHSHLLVAKDTSSDSFRTNVLPLDREGRIAELSRLISGNEITQASRAAAEEMLDSNK